MSDCNVDLELDNSFSAMKSSDFTLLSTNLTFLRGSTDSTLECVSISITDDALLEGNQTFTVTLTTSDPDVLLGNNVTVVTIEDNDSVLL